MKTHVRRTGCVRGNQAANQGSMALSRWLFLIVLVLVAHIVLIFIFGTRKPITPTAVKDAPKLELAARFERMADAERPDPVRTAQ